MADGPRCRNEPAVSLAAVGTGGFTPPDPRGIFGQKGSWKRVVVVVTGSLIIAGLGPGAEALVTPEVSVALAEATDVVGYIPYVARVAPRAGLVLHPSDNRVEMDRARAALEIGRASCRERV